MNMNIYAAPTPYQADCAAGFFVFAGRTLDFGLLGDPIGGPGPVITTDSGTPVAGTPLEAGIVPGQIHVPGGDRGGDTGL